MWLNNYTAKSLHWLFVAFLIYEEIYIFYISPTKQFYNFVQTTCGLRHLSENHPNKILPSKLLKVPSDEAEYVGLKRARKRLHGARNQGKGYYVAQN